MKKKIIGMLVCTLVILTAIPAVGTMNIKTNDVSKHESAPSDPVPDLECIGSIDLDGVNPGDEVQDLFHVLNAGEEGSLLDWEVSSWPSWGHGSSWTFTPAYGSDLPTDGLDTVVVTIVIPNTQGYYTGEIEVVNVNNPDDFAIIDVVIKMSKSYSLVYPFLGELVESTTTATTSTTTSTSTSTTTTTATSTATTSTTTTTGTSTSATTRQTSTTR